MERSLTKYCFVVGFIFACITGCNILGTTGQDDIIQLDTKEPIGFSMSDLDYVKSQLGKENNIFQEAYNNLLVEANKALNSYGYSVVTKEGSAPNGDKHEYVSRGRYWWPNPDTDDGLPYVKRDGQTNPEIYQYDRNSLSNLRNDIRKLSLMYYFSEEEKYARKAIKLLEQWFIDKDTEMKPNLKFAQGIPGKTSGRPAGIIEGVDIYKILNYIPILKESEHWNSTLTNDLIHWYNQLYNWLLDHEYGIAEKNSPNNHGSWYDVQIASYAYFLGHDKTLSEVTNRVKNKRIPEQIAPSGRQPYEMNRTQPLSYSTYNLNALTILASLSIQEKSKKLSATSSDDAQLWSYKNGESGSIEAAVQFLLPYLNGNQAMNTEPLGDFNPCDALPMLQRTYKHTGSTDLKNLYQTILDANPLRCLESNYILLYPFN